MSLISIVCRGIAFCQGLRDRDSFVNSGATGTGDFVREPSGEATRAFFNLFAFFFNELFIKYERA